MNEGSVRVLEALRAAGEARCSGESLKALLGVSRSAIWKHVENLRERGYGIEGAPGGGYVLAEVPDRLYPELLEPGARRWLARRVLHFEETDSTNRIAFGIGPLVDEEAVADQQRRNHPLRRHAESLEA